MSKDVGFFFFILVSTLESKCLNPVSSLCKIKTDYMRTAAKVFIIIGLVASVVLIVLGLVFLDKTSPNSLAIFYLSYGAYSFITSLMSLFSLNSGSKGLVVLCGIIYIPVVLLASIFMFCIDPVDLWRN